MPTTLAFGLLGHSLPNLHKKSSPVLRSGAALAGSGSQLLEQEVERGKEQGVCGWSCGSFNDRSGSCLKFPSPFTPAWAISWPQQQKSSQPECCFALFFNLCFTLRQPSQC